MRLIIVFFSLIIILIGCFFNFKQIYLLAILSLILNIVTLRFLINQKNSKIWLIGLFIVWSISFASFLDHSVYFVYSFLSLVYSRYIYFYDDVNIIRRNYCIRRVNREVLDEDLSIHLIVVSSFATFFILMLNLYQVGISDLQSMADNKFTIKSLIIDPFDHSRYEDVNRDVDKQIFMGKNERIIKSIHCGDMDISCYARKIDLINKNL